MNATVRSGRSGTKSDSEFPGSPRQVSSEHSTEVRFLTPEDIDPLMDLERKKWTTDQAADPEDLARRIAICPTFSVGAFWPGTREAVASLFVRPISLEEIHAANTWADCARVPDEVPTDTHSLFGISLTSVDDRGVEAVLRFLVPTLVKGGFQEIFLGSPLPGLRTWRRENPDVPVDTYAYATHNGRPVDPQLHYYYKMGFTRIVACKPDYFPHERSLDYGAVIRAELPLKSGKPSSGEKLPAPSRTSGR